MIQNPPQSRMKECMDHSSIIVIVIAISALEIGVFADRDLDALRGKDLAQGRALADAGELLGRVDIEDIAEARGQDGRSPVVHLDDAAISRDRVVRSNIDKRESKTIPTRRMSSKPTLRPRRRPLPSRGARLTEKDPLFAHSGPAGQTRCRCDLTCR